MTEAPVIMCAYILSLARFGGGYRDILVVDNNEALSERARREIEDLVVTDQRSTWTLGLSSAETIAPFTEEFGQILMAQIGRIRKCSRNPIRRLVVATPAAVTLP